MYDQMKRNSRDVSTFSEGDLPAQGDAPRTHPLHGHAVNISKSHGGGIGTAYATPTRGSYEVRRNGEHIGHYHESNLTKRRHNFAMTTLEPMKCNPTRSMNRGDSFAVDPKDHKSLLDKHEYEAAKHAIAADRHPANSMMRRHHEEMSKHHESIASGYRRKLNPPSAFGVMAGASMDPAVKNKKPDEAYFGIDIRDVHTPHINSEDQQRHVKNLESKGYKRVATGTPIAKMKPGEYHSAPPGTHSNHAGGYTIHRPHATSGPAKHSDEAGAKFEIKQPKRIMAPGHHEALTKHGYSYTGSSSTDIHRYSHPSGSIAVHYPKTGRTTVGRPGKIGAPIADASELHEHLSKLHGTAK